MIECYRTLAPEHAAKVRRAQVSYITFLCPVLIFDYQAHYLDLKKQIENSENYIRHYKPQLPGLLADYEAKKRMYTFCV